MASLNNTDLFAVNRDDVTYKITADDLKNEFNQDLGYTPNGNNDGTVTITDGTDATIPIVTDTTSGLMTGTDKQILDNLSGGSSISSVVPISVTNNKISLNYNKGLTLTNTNLETNIGNGLEYNNGAIQANLGNGLTFVNGAITSDIPVASTLVFPPIVISNGSGRTRTTARNSYTSSDIWTGNFTIPDGATQFALSITGITGMDPNITGNVDLVPNYQCVWAQGSYITMAFSGSGFSISVDQSIIIDADIQTMMVQGRRNDTYLTRYNKCTISGSGNRRVNYVGNGGWSDAQGSGDGTVSWSNLKMMIIPFS